MKHSITIQRLCLFLLVFLLAAPAWSKSYATIARYRSRGEVEGTRTFDHGIVTVTWSDCKTGPALTAANRNWVMKKGSSVTIRCKDGWRVRGFSIREQLENPTYINCVDDNRYKKKYYEFSDETHEKSLNISCWDAPSQDIRIEALKDVEFAVYEIDYVKAVSVGFKHSQYNVYSMSGWIRPKSSPMGTPAMSGTLWRIMALSRKSSMGVSYILCAPERESSPSLTLPMAHMLNRRVALLST